VLGAELVVEALAALDTLVPQPQSGAGVTYAAKIDKAEARVDWTRPATEILRQIRGLAPFPGAWCEVGGERVKLLFAVPADGAGPPGRVLDDRLTIACGSGALRPTRLQRAGGSATDAAAFLRGRPIGPGDRLG
jgi:methionyl-tRNA formyltransferase